MSEDLYRCSVTNGLGGKRREKGSRWAWGSVSRKGDAECCYSRGGCRPGLRLAVVPGWEENRTRWGTAWVGGFFQAAWNSWCSWLLGDSPGKVVL